MGLASKRRVQFQFGSVQGDDDGERSIDVRARIRRDSCPCWLVSFDCKVGLEWLFSCKQRAGISSAMFH